MPTSKTRFQVDRWGSWSVRSWDSTEARPRKPSPSSVGLTADQITCINLVIDDITQNGLMEPGELCQPPFTDQHDQGVIGAFPTDAQAIVGVIGRVNNNALVAQSIIDKTTQ